MGMEMPMEADLTNTESDDIYNDHLETLRSKLRETFEIAEKRKIAARGRYEKQYNKKARELKYEEGQIVFLHVPSVGRHRVKQLSKLWNGPYKIVKILYPLNVVLKIRKRKVTVHVNRIKPCMRRAPVPPQQAVYPRCPGPEAKF
ncbi:hypothetical protein J6590_087541 [Homalodisca vitripennis]|nr:hypothetical protein J6590_087541 [Homalodisca vitripennis]